MGLSERIDQDLKAALKAKEAERISTLRMLKAALVNAALAKNKAALEDGEVLEVVGKLVKQHAESVAAFEKGGRRDLAEKEKREAGFLKGYLPEPLSEEELKALIQATLRELKVSGPQALGQVMKALSPKVQGRAEGKRVNELVRQLLSKG